MTVFGPGGLDRPNFGEIIGCDPVCAFFDWPAGSREEGREFRPVAHLAPCRPSNAPSANRFADHSHNAGSVRVASTAAVSEVCVPDPAVSGMRRAVDELRVMWRSARDDDCVMEWTNERTIERRSRASVLVCGPLCKALARAGGYRGRPPRPTSLGPENVPFPEDLDCAARMA